MPTPAERRALLFLAALAALGVTARGIAAVRGAGSRASGDAHGLDRQIAAVDSAVAGSRTRSRPPRKSGTDARAREASVPANPGGKAGEPSGPPAQWVPISLYEARRREVEASNREARDRVAAEAERRSPTRIPSGPVGGPPPQGPSPAARPLLVDLDIAGPDAIAGLPWIGEALAARIVSERNARGPFGSLEGLQRVRGIGPSLAARIAPFVTFSRPGSQLPVIPSDRRRRGRGFRP